jgi:hypothetical protein
MKYRTFGAFLTLIPGMIVAEQIAGEKLEPYREYFEKWTCSGGGWEGCEVIPKSRYHTFKAAFEYIEEKGKVILELGTSRSFTHGGHIGCNSDDRGYWMPDQPENWDWGAGFFTRMAAHALSHRPIEIHTVDISFQHIERCKYMTYDLQDKIHYHVASSLDFLAYCEFPGGIDLIYLDTGDMTPIEPTAQLQLEEVKIIVERNLVADGGYILIDDVKNQTPRQYGDTSGLGKSKYSLPYLLNHGFEMVIDEYQVLLRKK